MRLSEAILEGCKISKKTTRKFITFIGDDRCTDALGAALLVTPVHPERGEIMALLHAYPELKYFDIVFPIQDHRWGYVPDLWDMICILNDRYDWTREQIATWLQEIGY